MSILPNLEGFMFRKLMRNQTKLQDFQSKPMFLPSSIGLNEQTLLNTTFKRPVLRFKIAPTKLSMSNN